MGTTSIIAQQPGWNRRRPTDAASWWEERVGKQASTNSFSSINIGEIFVGPRKKESDPQAKREMKKIK